MKHAAHAARKARGAHAHRAGSTAMAVPTFKRKGVRGAHTAVAVSAVRPVEDTLREELNKAPKTRKELRLLAARSARKTRLVFVSAATMLVGTVGTTVASAVTGTSPLSGIVDGTVSTSSVQAISAASSSNLVSSATAASRSESRSSLTSESTSVSSNNTSWSTDTSLNGSQMSVTVAESITHDSGDTGNAYSFSQCTWWCYVRRHQLGLPVGSYFGNGCQWAASAAALGYKVDNTPEVGAIMVFARGQEGASSTYGHVAIVESVNADGSVTTSECGASCNGKTFSRTFTNVSDFQYIHS